jgi:PTH1 family peptidyl-tRNA hydrolase
VGFEVADALARRWDLPAAKKKFNGLLTEGRAGIGGPRVAVLLPQTFMNEAGRSVGPARGQFRVDDLSRVLVLHDEIDLKFGDVRARVGGGLAGHNGLKSLKRELGDAGFARVRIGVGRPDSTDPDIVAGYVLGKWRQPRDEVVALIDTARDAAEAIVLGDAP